jgi:hypothetical protein
MEMIEKVQLMLVSGAIIANFPFYKRRKLIG